MENHYLIEKINEFAFRKAKMMIRKTMIIAYDLTDINKECSKKMERLADVWDGSKRKVTTGYTLHGVGINNILTRLEVHEGAENTQNQTRLEIIKTKFKLEKIRVLKHERLLNLIALIQFSVIVSTLVFNKLQQATNALTTGVLMFYKRFIRLKSLTFNLDSFITFMKDSLEPLIIRNKPPPQQLSLFSRRQVVKLGII